MVQLTDDRIRVPLDCYARDVPAIRTVIMTICTMDGPVTPAELKLSVENIQNVGYVFTVDGMLRFDDRVASTLKGAWAKDKSEVLVVPSKKGYVFSVKH
jgi:hypothetical protein